MAGFLSHYHKIRISGFNYFFIFYLLFRFVVAGKKLRKSIVPGSTKVFKFDDEFGLTYEQVGSHVQEFNVMTFH